MSRGKTRQQEMFDRLAHTLEVPPQLYGPLCRLAADRDLKWEEIAISCLYNGLTDAAIQQGDRRLVHELNEAMPELSSGPLKNMYVMQETWQQLDAILVHKPGEDFKPDL